MRPIAGLLLGMALVGHIAIRRNRTLRGRTDWEFLPLLSPG